MAEPIKRIFVSSPGDVSQERALAFRVIKRLQRDFVQHFRLIPVFWEKLPLEAADCFQAEIERISSPAEADVVVFILWSRLGTPLGLQFHKPDGSPYGSGTEYEFEVSVQARQDKGKPAILVYIKEAPIDPGKFSRNEVQQFSEILAQTHKVKDFIEQRFYDPGEQVFLRSFHTFKESPSFESLLEDHLRELLSQYLPEDAAARPLWEGAPFRGLQVFDYQHEDIFFGRSQAVMEIMNLLKRQVEAGCTFALVLGRSGSGKSSLVRAGVLPLLTRYGALPEVKVWRWAIITPSQSQGDLFEGLAAGILDPTALPELHTHASRGAELAQVMRESPAAALLLLRDCLGRLAPAASETGTGTEPASRLVLVIDQLEEIFNDAAVTPGQRQAYVHLLLNLAQSGLVWIIATLRSDYYQRCAELPDLMALKKDGTYDLAPPSPAELQQIITRPAAMAGLRFELRGQGGEPLDQHIFSAVLGMEAGLPLLEYTLEELYERRTPEGWLTYQAYDDLGGVEGALGRRAEAVFAALAPEVQAAFPEVFQELTAIAGGETERLAARSASWEELTATPARRQLVEAMVAARLFSADRIKDSAGASRAVVRVAHEALFRAWERLQDWLEQEKENLRVRSRVAVAADRWQAEGRRHDLLLPAGKPLEEALPLAAPGRVKLPPAEQEFIRASEARARRLQRLKQTAMATTFVGLLLLTAISIFSYYKNTSMALELGDDLMAQYTRTVMEKTANYFLPAGALVETSARLAKVGALACSNDEQLELFILGTLKSYPQIFWFYYADERGNFIRGWRLRDGTMEVRIIKRNGGQATDTFKYWDSDLKLKKSETSPLKIDYDPRVRPWYMGAKDAGANFWGDAYILVRNKAPAISTSFPVLDQTGKFVGVWSIDLELADISDFLASLKIGKNGLALILNDKNDVVAFPEFSRLVKEEKGVLRPVRVEELEIERITSAFQEYLRSGRGKFTITSQGQRFLVSFADFPSTFPARWKVGLVIPEDQFIGGAKNLIRATLFICLVVLGVAILLAFLISAGYRRHESGAAGLPPFFGSNYLGRRFGGKKPLSG